MTVGFGGLMMARWVARGGLRGGCGPRRSLPALNVAHFGLALAGLAAWIGYLVTGLIAMAWTACALLLPVAGFGMVLVSRWFPERSAVEAALPSAPPATGPARAWHPPALIVVTHVALAIATILFAVLATIAAG
jgi:hypothetical protein